MAKTKNKKPKNSAEIFEFQLRQLSTLFPKVKVVRRSENHPNSLGRDYVEEIILPNSYTLKSKRVQGMEIIFIEFSVQRKYCTEDQKPGIYRFYV